METPNNEAGRITEEVMAALDPKRLVPVEIYNRAYEANYALFFSLLEIEAKKIMKDPPPHSLPKKEEKTDGE